MGLLTSYGSLFFTKIQDLLVSAKYQQPIRYKQIVESQSIRALIITTTSNIASLLSDAPPSCSWNRVATKALIKVISFICCQHYSTLLSPTMQLEWPAAFSILNGPTRFYHTASFSLGRNNWQHGFSFHKHLPGLLAHRLATIHNATSLKLKCTAPLSASAYMVHMGLDKIWTKKRSATHS